MAEESGGFVDMELMVMDHSETLKHEDWKVSRELAEEMFRSIPELSNKFQLANFSMPIDISSIINAAVKSLPGFADFGVTHGNGDGPRTPPRCLDGSGEYSIMTIFTMTDNFSFMKCALSIL